VGLKSQKLVRILCYKLVRNWRTSVGCFPRCPVILHSTFATHKILFFNIEQSSLVKKSIFSVLHTFEFYWIDSCSSFVKRCICKNSYEIHVKSWNWCYSHQNQKYSVYFFQILSRNLFYWIDHNSERVVTKISDIVAKWKHWLKLLSFDRSKMQTLDDYDVIRSI